jgi:hypothetical protein
MNLEYATEKNFECQQHAGEGSQSDCILAKFPEIVGERGSTR